MNDNEKYIENFVKDILFDSPDNEHRDELKKQLLNSYPKHRLGSKKTTYKIWRIIMKNKISKLAAAAIIIIGAMLLASQFGVSIDGSSVVWGQVLSDMEKVSSVIYRTTVQITMDRNQVISSSTMIYDAGKNGSRIDMFMNNELFVQRYILPKENIGYEVRPSQNIFSRFELPENIGEISTDRPRALVKRILSEQYKELGRSEINGIKVEGVEVQDSTSSGENEIVRLWVDVENNLPVKIEIEGMMFEGGAYRPASTIIDEFQWDIILDKSIFVPNVPANSDGGQIMSTSEQYVNQTNEEKTVSKAVKEDVEKMFKACTEENWDEASKYLQNIKDNQRVKEILGGLEVNFIEEPYVSEKDPEIWLVPYGVKFKNGGVQVNTMGLQMNSETGTFTIRFGF